VTSSVAAWRPPARIRILAVAIIRRGDRILVAYPDGLIQLIDSGPSHG
jgi:hypothetical protein